MNLPGSFVYEGDFLRDAVCCSEPIREKTSESSADFSEIQINHKFSAEDSQNEMAAILNGYALWSLSHRSAI